MGVFKARVLFDTARKHSIKGIIGNDFMSYKDPSTIVSELQKLSEKQKISK